MNDKKVSEEILTTQPNRSSSDLTNLPRLGSPESADTGKGSLGSLTQGARLKKLNSAKNMLLFIGILTVIVNGIFLAVAPSQIRKEIEQEVAKLGPGRVTPAQIQQAEQEAVLLSILINGVGVALGVVFIVLGVMVKTYPVPCTITGLVLYIVANIGFALLNPLSLATGAILKIVVVVVLFQAMRTAMAYEKEEREQRHLSPAHS